MRKTSDQVHKLFGVNGLSQQTLLARLELEAASESKLSESVIAKPYPITQLAALRNCIVGHKSQDLHSQDSTTPTLALANLAGPLVAHAHQEGVDRAGVQGSLVRITNFDMM